MLAKVERSKAAKPLVPTSTVVWGQQAEHEDFLKVPRTLTRLGRYERRAGKEIQPRHIILLLALAGRKFRDDPIRARWQDLATDLGVKSDTVRKWAYELKKMKLLSIHRMKSATPTNDRRNIFDINPFVECVNQAFEQRLKDRKERAAKAEQE